MIKRLILLVLDVHGKLLRILETEHPDMLRDTVHTRGIVTCTEAYIAALRHDIKLELFPIDPLASLHRPNQIVMEDEKPKRRGRPPLPKAVAIAKKGCSCTLCGMIADKLEEGEASQIGELEDWEIAHLEEYEYDNAAPDMHPDLSKRGRYKSFDMLDDTIADERPRQKT